MMWAKEYSYREYNYSITVSVMSNKIVFEVSPSGLLLDLGSKPFKKEVSRDDNTVTEEIIIDTIKMCQGKVSGDIDELELIHKILKAEDFTYVEPNPLPW